jgi:hypothetical protein
VQTQRACLCLWVLTVLAISPLALAGGNNPDVKAVVHVRAHNVEAGCDYTALHGEILTCEDIVTSEPGHSFDAFPVFFDLNEYRGCEDGMTWPSFSHSANFTNCADLVIGGILNPGDGASHAWHSCQSGVCVPGFIWLYADSSARVCLIPHPVSRFIMVLDCSYGVDLVFWAYCAAV